ncbi:hypothetical protein [Isoalcanivorax indicus]|uniref:hypothetical protein n=1 Tax=Isoalcanivorax indicus TaxID=2202653 RepID=UPI000DB9037D|nr:hypothetical protein [Isoalcanivorax indicus]
MMNSIKWPLISLAAVTLAACGGTSSQDGSRQGASGTEGRITINGGLAGATIFVDMNGSDSHDDDEPIGYTDSQGFFGYNPITRINYCRSDNPLHRQHCLRLPSLDNLPDEVTVFYYGGVDMVTGQQNDSVYRYHVQVDALRGRTLDLDGALAMVSAIADSEDSLDILYGIIDAFYQVHIENVAPFMLVPMGRSMSDSELSAQAKFDALVAQGIFTGLDDSKELDDKLTRAEVSKILAAILKLPTDPPSQGSFPDISGDLWSAGYLADFKAGKLAEQTDGKFPPNKSISLEEMAILLTRTLGGVTPTDPNDIAQWASEYLSAAIELGLMPPNTDTTSAATRSQLIEASFFVNQDLFSDPDPQVNNPLSRLSQWLINALKDDEDLNNSFTSAEFDVLLESLIALAEEAENNNQTINLARLAAFLNDLDRDLENTSLGDFLLDKDFFDATLVGLSSHVIDIRYDDPAKGNGRVQLRLIPASGGAPLDGGTLQACLRYEEVGTLPQQQLFGDPLYVSGQWSRLNDNSLLLNLNLLPGAPYHQVLQLDWAQVASGQGESNNLTSIGFDLTGSLDAWDIALLPVASEWLSLGNHAQGDNASCALLLSED